MLHLSHYVFLNKTYHPLQVFAYLNHNRKSEASVIYDGHLVNMNSTRLHVFSKSGCHCVACGVEGTHFRLQKTRNDTKYHFGLWTDSGVQMTKDHIIPRSRGGSNCMSNLQTMCLSCNTKKGNNFTSKDAENGTIRKEK